jgi:hypothetical protein
VYFEKPTRVDHTSSIELSKDTAIFKSAYRHSSSVTGSLVCPDAIIMAAPKMTKNQMRRAKKKEQKKAQTEVCTAFQLIEETSALTVSFPRHRKQRRTRRSESMGKP